MKRKIAIVNQWPNTPNAERENVERIKTAATLLDVETVVIDKWGYDLQTGKEITPRDVQFVINLHYETPKSYDAFSYVALWNPLDFYCSAGYPRHSAHIASHDDFLTCGSPWADDHVRRQILQDKTRLPPVLPMHHSLAGPIFPPRVEAQRNVFYCGINWERVNKVPGRYEPVLKILDEENVLRIFGPVELGGIKVWEGFQSYAGPLPFDGTSVVEEIARCGMALVFSSDAHKRSALMSNRLFESAAAGAVILCDDHPFARKYFGDSLLYVDTSRPAAEVAAEVLRHHTWARENPTAACALARSAQAIFLKNFCLKKELQYLLQHHQNRAEQLQERYRARRDRHRVRLVHLEIGPSVDRLQPLLESLKQQTYRNFELLLLTDESCLQAQAGRWREALAGLPFAVTVRPARLLRKGVLARPLGEILCDLLPEWTAEDLVCLSVDSVRLFADHLSCLVRLFEDDPSVQVAFSDVLLQYTDGPERRELQCVRSPDDLQNLLPGGALAHCLFRKTAVRDQDLPFLRYLDEWLPFFLYRANVGAVAYSRRATLLQPANLSARGCLGLKEQAYVVGDAFPEIYQDLARVELQHLVAAQVEARLQLVENWHARRCARRKKYSVKEWFRFLAQRVRKRKPEESQPAA